MRRSVPGPAADDEHLRRRHPDEPDPVRAGQFANRLHGAGNNVHGVDDRGGDGHRYELRLDGRELLVPAGQRAGPDDRYRRRRTRRLVQRRRLAVRRGAARRRPRRCSPPTSSSSPRAWPPTPGWTRAWSRPGCSPRSPAAPPPRARAPNNNDWLNIGYTDSGTYGSADSVWSDPITAADATAGWLKGQNTIPGYGTASSGIQAILSTAGQPPAAQIAALQSSGWASSGYRTCPRCTTRSPADGSARLIGRPARARPVAAIERAAQRPAGCRIVSKVAR